MSTRAAARLLAPYPIPAHCPRLRYHRVTPSLLFVLLQNELAVAVASSTDKLRVDSALAICIRRSVPPPSFSGKKPLFGVVVAIEGLFVTTLQSGYNAIFHGRTCDH